MPAFFFLTSHRRRALRLLYAVCRVLDDAVDLAGEPDSPVKDPGAFLADWKRVFNKREPEWVGDYDQQDLAREFLDVALKYDVPLFAMIDLVEKGVAVDLAPKRFQTPMELEAYCYGVAGTVGLACLPIFGVPWAEAKDFAIRLGIAVQWINTIRDVGMDAKIGRIYIPLDHLDQFGYTEENLFARTFNGNFVRLMKYEANVARSHYKRALELLPPRWERELLPARIMGGIYLSLLAKVEKRNFRVFKEKIRLNFLQKGLSTWKAIKE